MMPLDQRYFQSLRQQRRAIKPALLGVAVFLGLLAQPAQPDIRQPCPDLRVTPACGPEGQAEAQIKAPADLPQGLRLLLAVPGGAGTYVLTAGQSVAISTPGPAGGQLALTVVGLEGTGDSAEGCCFSSHTLRRAACPVPEEATSPDGGTDDFAVSLTLPSTCPRAGCVGRLDLEGPGQVPQTLTLDSDIPAEISSAACLGGPPGSALCDLVPGTGIDVSFVPDPATPAGEVRLCASLGIGETAGIRTLALQKALAQQGYDPGPLDGAFGPGTRAALDRMVGDAGLPAISNEIPPELLDLLGLSGLADADPANDSACAETTLPRPVLACDPATTRATGMECACRFKGMRRASATRCTCPKGQKLGAKGCAEPRGNPDAAAPVPTPADPAGPACDPATTVLRKGVCQCRGKTMVRVSETRCEPAPEIRLCPNGLPDIPGIGCKIKAPGCSRTNAVGECCDDLPAGDASCR